MQGGLRRRFWMGDFVLVGLGTKRGEGAGKEVGGGIEELEVEG